MRVSSIGSYNAIKMQKKQAKPSFQADVRVDYRRLYDFPPKLAVKFQDILTKAETAYENEGSDNLLFELTPVVTGEKGRFVDSRVYRVWMDVYYKDPEIARKEILQNREKESLPCDRGDVVKLKERDPEIMKRLKMKQIDSTPFYLEKEAFEKMEGILDEGMKDLIWKYTTIVPKKPRIEPSTNGIKLDGYDLYKLEDY